MTITQQPSAINLSGNVSDIIIEDVAAPVSFKLYQGTNQVLDELYYPDIQRRVHIKFRELVDMLLYAEVPDYSQAVFHQKNTYSQFTANLADQEPIVFTVVKGFLQRAEFDVDQFLAFNWLTTQPTSKTVKFHDPEWLTCYPLEAVDVRVRATFANGTTQTITYTTLAAGKAQSINLNPGLIIGQFSAEPLMWEVYTEASGQQRQYIQTYRYSTDCDEYDDLFVFQNRLGGIDTVRFTGTSTRSDSTQFESARFDDYIVDFFAEPELAMQKSTGSLATRAELDHALDFFRSMRKFHLTRGYIAGIFIAEKPALESTKGLLNNYRFGFSYSDFKVAYPEIAIPPQLLELPE